ncbi:selenium-dependent xanthine dehydrogenase [Pelosinus sp. UFO1]|uniref:selenium-dependent xanthine dehydrogenase n=1 Tax=Pelosinus sp. UFO1 TaxID=484770 RepID=UPI0004D17C72|nr:selenium-dependent xanthine dehydrogenase [Pelosinus sp. UFO1]AIF51399.1 selenium-dependent molybdenum hydroxylase 1 [Pelosinus sp. UFO1]
MFRININNKIYSVKEDMNLLNFLRDEASLTSVKNGCGEGACGACMVLVDGKAFRACLLRIAKLGEKKVITVEGLSQREKDIYSWAFAQAGAVQCGFCIPGMVISAKALLDGNLNPTKAEIKRALQGNICRCTGYIKIEKAVAMVAKALREDTIPQVKANYRVGENMQRVDAAEKVLGTGIYVDDMKVEDMLYGAVLRAKYPRALVQKIDISAAKLYPGVKKVLTAKDVPGQRFLGHIVPDWPALIAEGEETRYVGDALVLVAATSKKIADEALRLIEVVYQKLDPILSPRQALEVGAPQIHSKGNLLNKTILKRGNVEEAIAKAKYVITQRYTTPPTEHAFLEPESALAVPSKEGTLTVYTGTQSVYDDHHGIVAVLGVADDKVRVISKLVGGGFGGKEDLSVQHHAALLAWHTGKPVKLTLSRQESIRTHPKRHAMEMEFTTACDENGKLTAVKAFLLADTGAYASLGGPVLQRACTHAAGPYQIENVDITGMGVYTNNPPAGAFRGFGVTQSCFAMESNLNLLAEQVGISPWEIRYLNAIEPGKVLTNGQIADEGTALKETLLAVRDIFNEYPDAGIACAMKNSGLGVGVPDVGRVRIKVEQGKVIIFTSAACMGQGLATTLIQIVSEATGLHANFIETYPADTMMTPNGGTSTASRQTVFNGEAARQAALLLKADLEVNELSQLEDKEYYKEYCGVTDPMNSDKLNPVSHVAYGYATQIVILDENGKIKKIVAAHDVGKAINPTSVEGQIEGGVVMSLGYALTEDFPLENGMPTAKFGTLGLFRSIQVPDIDCILVEKNPSSLAYGAKGVGEIVSIPGAPAVACAYYRRDGKIRNSLPLKNTAYSKKRII